MTVALELRVENITQETSEICCLTLRAPDGADLPPADPGAHVEVTTLAGLRAYSLLATGPNLAEYRIAVKREDDGQGGSRAIHALAVGDTITASAPKNDFPLTGADVPVLLIGGGIGITPLVPMAAALKARGARYALHLCARNATAMAFRDVLTDQHAEAFHPWFDDTALADFPALIQTTSPKSHIYICGPRGMIDTVRALAETAGFTPDQIHIELFENSATAEGDTAFEVEIKDSGEVFTIPPGRSIIEVLEEAGIDLVYDCTRGDCGICQTDVIDGVPDHRDVVLSDAERDSGRVMQICVSRAKSARLVLDL